MSSPFAQKFFSKKPFSSTPKKQEKDYEAIGKKAVELEKKYSTDRGDAPDYEARLMVQKELSKKSNINYGTPLNEVDAKYGSSSAYVSIEPAIRRLQENLSQTTQPSTKNKDKKTTKKNQVVDTSTGKQVDASKPTKDLSKKTKKYNQFQDLTRVQSVDGNLVRVDGKGNMYSMKFDELGKKVLDMDQLSKAAKIMTKR